MSPKRNEHTDLTNLGILMIHGMGDSKASYAEGLLSRVIRSLRGDGLFPVFERCFWSPLLQEHQERVWVDIMGQRLGHRALRKWVVGALGDPVAYLSGYLRQGRPIYERIHEKVRQSLELLEKRLAERDGEKLLLILAHSLGAVIASNYVWDEQHNKGLGQTSFERAETLVGIITYGSTIPLFLPTVRPLECINLPGTLVKERYCDIARWLNMYATPDLLGYPIANTWDERHGTVVEDRVLRRRWNPRTWGPWSHTHYEKDGRVAKCIYAELVRLASRSQVDIQGATLQRGRDR